MKKLLITLLFLLPIVAFGQSVIPQGNGHTLNANKGGFSVDSFAQVAPVTNNFDPWYGMFSDFRRVNGKLYWFDATDSTYKPVGDGSILNTISLPNIDSLLSYSGQATTLIVTDSLRGGIFYKSSIGTVDSGIIFPATDGNYWVRQYDGRKAYVTWFGAVHDGVTDDTYPIQKTINYVFNKRGGTVYFPIGLYIINGTLNRDISGRNCQLYFPPIGNSGDTSHSDWRMTIKMEGEIAPTTNANDLPSTIHGASLYSTIQGTGTVPSIIGGNSTSSNRNFNAANIVIENLNFRVKSNIEGSGPTMSCIDLYNVTQAQIRNVVCSIDTNYRVSISPTAQVFGIRMPQVSNNDNIEINNFLAVGFYYGAILGDNCNANLIEARACNFAISLLSTSHPIYIQTLQTRHCPYAIGISGGAQFGTGFGSNHSPTTFTVANMDMEHITLDTTKWYDKFNIQVYDHLDMGYGNISGGAYDNVNPLIKDGGNNIRITPIKYSGDRKIISGNNYLGRGIYNSIQHVQYSLKDAAYFALNGYDSEGSFAKDDDSSGSIRIRLQTGKLNDSTNFAVLMSDPNSSTEDTSFQINRNGDGSFKGTVQASPAVQDNQLVTLSQLKDSTRFDTSGTAQRDWVTEQIGDSLNSITLQKVTSIGNTTTNNVILNGGNIVDNGQSGSTNTIKRINNPAAINLTGTTPNTGSVVFKHSIPASGGTYVSFKISGVNGSSESFTIMGNFIISNNTIFNGSYSSLLTSSSANPSVTEIYARIDPSGKLAICVGGSGTIWGRCSISLDQITTSYSNGNLSMWDDGWTNELVTDFTGYTSSMNLNLKTIANEDWVQAQTKYGTATLTGDNSQTSFTIAHGLSSTPTSWSISANDSAGANALQQGYYVTADTTNLTIIFLTAPAAGDFKIAWVAYK